MVSFDLIVADLAQFCQGTRNAHQEIMNREQELKTLSAALRSDAISLGDEVETNYNEAKKMRRVLVGYVDASLRVMEACFVSAPVSASSFVIRRGAEAGSTGPGFQADSLKPARKRKRRAENAATREPESLPAATPSRPGGPWRQRGR